MKDWYKDAVVYQIYIRSFYDSNGDGIGDLRGVIEKIDYIAGLGVDVIWLSPFCESPNRDNGYDISDYRKIMTEFGTMNDFDELMAQCKKRNIEVMMDLVLNHTSDKHEWFQESKSSKNNPKRDYYIWAEGKNGTYPNNWESYFTESAWTFDEKTGEYYLHQFMDEQPDLNWKNPELRREMIDTIKWWQGKGIHAFRLDAIHHIGKPDNLPDAPVPEIEWHKRVFCNTPETHDLLKEINREIFAHDTAMSVGETGSTTFEMAKKYVNTDRNELNMIFHFGHLYAETMSAKSLRKYFKKWYRTLSPKGWDAVFFSNHDLPRHISAFGNDSIYRVESAKAFATLLFTMWGTPYIYQGEEIGMTNVRFDSLDDYRDIASRRWIEWGMKYRGMSYEESLEYFIKKNRDNSRTPMQWADTGNAGFSTHEPWIKVNPNYHDINVDKSVRDAGSVLTYYREMIKLRKSSNALRRGTLSFYGGNNGQVIAYVRKGNDGEYLIMVNFSDNSTVYHKRIFDFHTWKLVAFNSAVAEGEFRGKINLKPWEARVYKA